MYKFKVIQFQTTNIKNQQVTYHSYCEGKVEPEDMVALLQAIRTFVKNLKLTE